MRGLWIWLGLTAPPPQIEEVILGPQGVLEARADRLRADLQEVDQQLAEAWEWGDVEEAQCVEARRHAIRTLLIEVENASTELSMYAGLDSRVDSAVRRAILADERARQLVAEVTRCTEIGGCDYGLFTVRVEGPREAPDLARSPHPDSIERHRW